LYSPGGCRSLRDGSNEVLMPVDQRDLTEIKALAGDLREKKK
jgi:hypothetical protein